MTDTLFVKIIQREIPANILYQDDLVTVFADINPQAPVHLLIVPNKHIPTLDDVMANDEACMGRMIRVAADIARQQGLGEDGYRLIINCKEDGGQEVYHIHMHLVGGVALGPMLHRPSV